MREELKNGGLRRGNREERRSGPPPPNSAPEPPTLRARAARVEERRGTRGERARRRAGKVVARSGVAGGGAAMEDVEVDGERERRRGQQRGRQVRRGEEVAGEAGGGARPSGWGAAWRPGADRWAPPHRRQHSWVSRAAGRRGWRHDSDARRDADEGLTALCWSKWPRSFSVLGQRPYFSVSYGKNHV